MSSSILRSNVSNNPNHHRKALWGIAMALSLLPVAGQSPVVIPAGPGPDIKVSLAVSPMTAAGELTYAATVVNGGPVPAPGVLFEEWLPADGLIVSLPPSLYCVSVPGFVKCGLGALAPGESRIVAIRVHPITVGEKEATAVAVSSLADPNPSNNTGKASIVITEVAVADVAASLTVTGPVHLGENLTYLATVRNLGDDDAAHVTLIDPLLPDLHLISAVSSQGTCTPFGTSVACAIGNIAVGGTVKVRIVVQPTSPGIIYDAVFISATTVDPNLANKSAMALTWVD